MYSILDCCNIAAMVTILPQLLKYSYNVVKIDRIFLQRLQYSYNGYNIATMGTIFLQWVQYCYNEY